MAAARALLAKKFQVSKGQNPYSDLKKKDIQRNKNVMPASRVATASSK